MCETQVIHMIQQILNSALRVRPISSSRITEFSQHEANGCEAQEDQAAEVEIFPVLGKPAATIEPRNGALDDRLYNVAKLDFEWSSIIERRGRRRQPLLVAVGLKQDPSQFVAGDSESTQGLMNHLRPTRWPAADGGAHGPAHGSPSAASARIVRSYKNGSTASDRGLCSSRAERTALEKTAESQRCATSQCKDGDRDGVER